MFSRSRYQYDKVNREVATWRDGPQDELGTKGERFWFSTNNQLTRAVYKANNVWTANPSSWATFRDYNYAPGMLNWTSVNDNGYVAPFVANALNQYTSINGSVPHYDDRFNLDAFGGLQYPHDSANRLTSATGNGHSASFTYDGLGRCVRRTVDGVTRVFAYDGRNPICEWDQAGNWKAVNLYGFKPDEILGRYDATLGYLIYKQDKQGNVTFVLNASNLTVEKYTYDAYGSPTILSTNNTQLSTSAIGNRFMYTGREWIGELGIYDYRHRYYHPGLGRFLETDPIGLQTEGAKLTAGQKALFSPGGQAPEAFGSSEMNLYRYCHNDPVNHSDPMGLYVSGLTSWGGGDWVRGMNGITNRDKDLINQARLHDFLNSEKTKDVARDAAGASHSTNVEHGAAFGNKGPNDIALGPTTASTDDPQKNVDGRHGVFNTTDFARKPLPPGYTLRGGIWGIARHQDNWPTGDRRTLWENHMSGVLGIPAQDGSQNRRPEVLIYEYVPGSSAPPLDN